MRSHELARRLLELPDTEVVHPGQSGDVGIERAYLCQDYGFVVLSDREETYQHDGSENGRRIKGPRSPMMDRSLQEIREWLEEHRGDGVKCPACSQLATSYRRKLNSTMARGLLWLHAASDPGTWVDVRETAPSWLLGAGGSFAKLKLWGLIEEARNTDTGKTHSGIWRVTESGHAFASRSSTVPGYAIIYDGRLLRLDGEPIDIAEALGSRFDYQELLNGGRS